MKITVAQIESTPGAVSKTSGNNSNLDKIIKTIISASNDCSDIVVFPEGMIHGYMSMDLILNPDFIRDGERDLEKIAEFSKTYKEMFIIVGTFTYIGDELRNVAAVINNGRIDYAQKRLLPEYDIFFENRYFSPGPRKAVIFDIAGESVGICVCEDMWDSIYNESPVEDLAAAGADLIINISHSPYYIGKDRERDEIIRNHAKKNCVDFLYVNAVGTHDGYDGEVVFEGGSRYYGRDGELKWKAPYFEPLVKSIDTLNLPRIDNIIRLLEEDNEVEKLRKALVSGINSYCDRTGFKKVVLGMSGGIDSALAAALCCDAIGHWNVSGITMPSEFSSEGSVNHSVAMAEMLGFKIIQIPITKSFDTVKESYYTGKQMTALNNADIGDTVAAFTKEIKPLTNENIQPRLRMLYLMSYSNDNDALLITTGNKTELALGYCTLYGDMAGGLAVLADIDKLVVRKLFKHYIDCWRSRLEDNYGYEAGMEAVEEILNKPPSAELAPNQSDEKAFEMSFEDLVPIVNQIIDGQHSLETIIKTNSGIDKSKIQKFWKRIKSQEFKRRQVSPGIKVTPKAFGIGRRIPMTHGW